MTSTDRDILDRKFLSFTGPSSTHCRVTIVGLLPSIFAGLFCTVFVGGCGDDTSQVRQIQVKRQQRMEAETQQDHLGEVIQLIRSLEGLNVEKANRQIAYHLNQWSESQQDDLETETPAILKTLSGVADQNEIVDRATRQKFDSNDVSLIRDAYLFGEVIKWADSPESDDPLLEDWFDTLKDEKGNDHANKLKRAARLFDWTTRNIALEPTVGIYPPSIPVPPLPLGMIFEGPGYRQTDFQTLRRGAGDAQQRAAVFIDLCHGAEIPAAFLATQSSETGELTPWAIGVLVDDQIYLFEPELGLHIPGPGEVGVATLAQARTDESVMRRLNLPLKKYRLAKDDIQQSVALLNRLPEGISPRMRRLESSLTGDRRMTLHMDVAEYEKSFDDVTGISGVRLWKVPLMAEPYVEAVEAFAEREPFLMYWLRSRWGIIDSESGQSENLSLARWLHLTGQFATDEIDATKGARTLYVNQRAPEFEIDDLGIDVNLQKHYGIRRDLGRSSEEYKFMVAQYQSMMRQGKRAASYWIALLQYDDGRFETSRNWLEKRVLDEEKPSPWFPAARYNLGRVAEQLGDVETAMEMYKSEKDPQEHGNRIRSRLLNR